MSLSGTGEGRINRRITEDFQGSENSLYNTIMIDLYVHYTFVLNYRVYNTKSASYGIL